jgi:hypothetical protein
VELQRAFGSAVDQLRQLVAVAIAFVEEREQKNFGAAFAELTVVRHSGAAYVAVTYMSRHRESRQQGRRAGRQQGGKAGGHEELKEQYGTP